MDRKMRRHLSYGVFVAILVNLAVGYLRDSIDYTAVAVSLVGLLGLLNGARKSDKDEDEKP